MNLFIKFRSWINTHEKVKQWLWFVMLWFAGLFTVFMLTLPLKWLVMLMK